MCCPHERAPPLSAAPAGALALGVAAPLTQSGKSKASWIVRHGTLSHAAYCTLAPPPVIARCGARTPRCATWHPRRGAATRAGGAEHLSRCFAVAPPAADDEADAGGEDFFGFFVDMHKNLAKELGDEFQRIPEASGKICTRLGLPICAQMRNAVAKSEPPPQPLPASTPPPAQKA